MKGTDYLLYLKSIHGSCQQKYRKIHTWIHQAKRAPVPQDLCHLEYLWESLVPTQDSLF